MSTEPAFAIGIDLGTTNSALAFAPFAGDEAAPAAFPIPQVTAPGQVDAETLLPSFLYVAAPDELPAGALALPWDPDARAAVGRFARDHGAQAPTKLIASAKSWLSYDGVDRRAPILPWQAPEGVLKLSPVGASIRYLGHLLEAWDHAHPDAPLRAQDVVLTVPASFDAVAREMTVEAARLADLGETIRLLEEPVAALYAWAAERGPAWRDEVSVGDTILVVDLGGGTTDLSLIAVREEQGRLALERIAVGDHILLGGDNMDLALAWTVKAALESEGRSVDDWQMRVLTHQCRQGKEALLSDPSRDAWPVSLVKRGSSMFGGTVRTELTRAQLDAVLLEGFFPRVGPEARPAAPRRSGLTTLGLPYAQDAAITKHLAAFLARAAPEGQPLVHPSAVLFNGGVTRSPVLRQRVLEVLTRWVEGDGGAAPRVLEGRAPDDAVARGAAYYAWARRRGGVRIRGGTSRAHYVGIEQGGLAIPGVPPRVDAVCIAPQGMEEGSETALDETFGLVVGEPVSFRFFAGERPDDALGAVVPQGEMAGLTELAPIEAQLEGPSGQVRAVTLQARITEVGTLELSAVEEGGKRYKLSFDVSVR